MEKIVAIALLGFLTLGEAQVQAPQARADCWDTAMTQLAMSECATADLKRAEDELKRAYEELLARAAAANATAVPKLKAAQVAWLAYRDAQIEAVFADDDKMHYGSVYPMCVRMLRTKWAAQRTAELKEMMSPGEDGVVCQGDRHLRNQ